MRIHTVGDSHSKYGWEKIENVFVHHIGPKLCYSVGISKLKLVDGSIELEYENATNRPPWIPIHQGDMVIFCFGEIDCRCHIHKRSVEKGSHELTIDDIASEYFKTIAYNATLVPNLKIAIYNVLPPCRSFKDTKNAPFPVMGSEEDRKKYHKYFNLKLKEKCNEYGYIFFDVYSKYEDANGLLNKKFARDEIHIDYPNFLEEKLKEILG